MTEFVLFDVAEPVLNGIGLGLVSDQIDISYTALNQLSIEEVGFVNDLITVPDRYLHDVVEFGQGPLQTVGTEAGFVAHSAIPHGGNAVDTVVDYAQDQVDIFSDAEAASVPASVRRALTNAEAPADAAMPSAKGAAQVAGAVVSAPSKVTRGVVAGQRDVLAAPRTVAKTPRTVAKGVQDGVRKAAHSAKKAAGHVRKAVKDSQPGNTGEKKSADKEDTE